MERAQDGQEKPTSRFKIYATGKHGFIFQDKLRKGYVFTCHETPGTSGYADLLGGVNKNSKTLVFAKSSLEPKCGYLYKAFAIGVLDDEATLLTLQEAEKLAKDGTLRDPEITEKVVETGKEIDATMQN